VLQNELCKNDVDFLKHIGGEIIDFDDGYAQLAFEIQPFHKQHLGIVNGGAIATLADHAGWYAVISQLDKNFTSATIEIKINYLKPANGDILTAIAKVVNRTKRTAFVTIEVLAKNILVAYATGTYAILEDRNNNVNK